MKLINNNGTAEITADQFENAMAHYAVLEKKATEINKAIETEVNDILEKYEPDLQVIAQNRKIAFDMVQAYCTKNKTVIFSKRRSKATQHGVAGFRLGTPRLKTTKGKDWNTILIDLSKQLPDYVRSIREPAKDLLLADRHKEPVASLLGDLGIQVVQDEIFYIDVKKAA